MQFVEKNLSDRIILGRIGSPYGVKGWSKVISFTDPPHNILNYKHWLIEFKGQWIDCEIETGGKNSLPIVARLSISHDRDQAKLYTNCLIAVNRSALPLLNKEEFYWADLIDIKVVNQEGVELGKVIDLLATGSNDVLVVKGERRHLIPYTLNVIKSVDLENKLLTVDWDPDF